MPLIATVVALVLLVGPLRPQLSPDVPAAAGFEQVSRQAQAAREAGRAEDAIRLYREAVALRPDWGEGFWYLGGILHDSGRHADGLDAMRRFVELEPRNGAGWALLGLCELGTGDLDRAREHLAKGFFEIGLPSGELKQTALRQLAVLYVKHGEFERAHDPLRWLAKAFPPDETLLDTIGLALLRMPLLASEIPAARRDLVRRTGRAGYFHLALKASEARTAYEELLAAYPGEPWVHYLFGVNLKVSDPQRALAELRRELELQPVNVFAQLEVAYLLLTRGEFAEAREAAARAVELAPDLFAAHHALGRALLELGELPPALAELEAAQRLASDVEELEVSLAQAYARAGRPQDAARARARAAKLRERKPAPPSAGDGGAARP